MTIEMAETSSMSPDDNCPDQFFDPEPLDDILAMKLDNNCTEMFDRTSLSSGTSDYFDTSPFQDSQSNVSECIGNNLHPDVQDSAVQQSTHYNGEIGSTRGHFESSSKKNSLYKNESANGNCSVNKSVKAVNDESASPSIIAFQSNPSEYSARTQQLLDLLDLATGRKPISGYSILKDRIGTLMRNATRKKWGNSQGPRWTGLGVINIVHSVEKRNKKPIDPELIHRGTFVPKKGIRSDLEATKHAGQWKTEVSKDQFANVPEPSFAEKLRSHMNSIYTNPLRSKKGRESDNSTSSGKRQKVEVMGASNTMEDSKNEYLQKTRVIVTSLCENVDNNDILLENAETSVKNNHSENECENFSSKITFINILDNAGEDEILPDKPPIDFSEDAEISFSVTSINDYLASQFENSLSSEGTNIYFIEEECVMLSPYSNEAKLYKLLFPGQRIPVQEGELNEAVQCAIDETVTEWEPTQKIHVESCVESIVGVEPMTECATVVEPLPILSSPYTDDMWVSESEEEADKSEPEREPTPKQESVKEPTPQPIREPTPQPIRERTPEPIREQTPDPIPETAKPKKEKRNKPEKQKKIYDRNFLKAVQMNQSDIVEQLLWDGADPNTSCSIGTVLHQAAQLGFTYTVQVLLWGGSDTEIRNELGDTALHLAAISGHNDIVFMLAAHGCDVDAGNNYDITPLHMALSYGKLDVIQTLVRMDADPNAEDRIGDTPTILAEQLGYPKNALDPSAAEVGQIKQIPIPLNLVHAVESCSTERVQLALSKKASPDTIVPLSLHWPGHSTVLHRASHLGLAHIVRSLLAAGANVNARDMVGNTPLHTAVQDGHDDVVQILLDGGASRNAITQSGVTPLHRAAARGHQSTMELLFKHGADISLKDNQNRTPIDWAKQKGFMVVARNMAKYSK